MAIKKISTKYLSNATYILGIRICRYRSRRLLALSQFMHIISYFKIFGMENSKKGFISLRHKFQISKEHLFKTLEDRALIENILIRWESDLSHTLCYIEY